MQTRRLLFLAAGLAALLLPAPASAQTVRAGMTEAQVRSTLGAPAAVRRADDWSYLFYLNGCAVRCGSDDVVFLREGRVVTAVFRTPRRRFQGPAPTQVLEDQPSAGPRIIGRPAGTPAAREAAPAEVTGIRMTIPGSENVSLGEERGTIIFREATEPEAVHADTALDRTRQLRERNVVPRTIPPDDRQAPVADTLLDQRRRERERAVEPRTIRPTSPR